MNLFLVSTLIYSDDRDILQKELVQNAHSCVKEELKHCTTHCMQLPPPAVFHDKAKRTQQGKLLLHLATTRDVSSWRYPSSPSHHLHYQNHSFSSIKTISTIIIISTIIVILFRLGTQQRPMVCGRPTRACQPRMASVNMSDAVSA